MISKKFFQAKQKIEESVTQTDKTEMMSPELSQMYRMVELMKTTLSETRKKMKDSVCSSSDGQSNANFEGILSKTLLTEAEKYPTDTLFNTVLHKIGIIESGLSMEAFQYNMRLNSEVLEEVTRILQVGMKNIEKRKEKLAAARLELDTCRSRMKTATNPNPPSQKQVSREVELFDASSKFENQQDLFHIEVLKMLASEEKCAQIYTTILEASRDFHYNSLKILETTLPELRNIIQTTRFQPIFGLSIQRIKEIFGSQISNVIKECCDYIEETGVDTEGIFRVGGSSNKLKKIKAAFDAGLVNLKSDQYDANTIASCLKIYLRELPEPLLTWELEDDFILGSVGDEPKRIVTLKNVLTKLPIVNFANLKYIIRTLSKVAKKSDVNKMSAINLGIVVGPNLLWAKNNTQQVPYSSATSLICTCLIENYSTFFGSQNTSPNSDSSTGNSATDIVVI